MKKQARVKQNESGLCGFFFSRDAAMTTETLSAFLVSAKSDRSPEVVTLARSW
jgi:hypothetical protein